MPKVDKGDSTVLVLCRFCDKRVLGHIEEVGELRAKMVLHEQKHRDEVRRAKP